MDAFRMCGKHPFRFSGGNTGGPDAGLAGPGILSGQMVAGLDEAHNFFIGQSIIQDYRNP